jgi:hypothetical protein
MRRALGLIVVLLAACGLVACGSGDGASDVLSPEDVAAAAARTAKVETYKASFESVISVGGQTVKQNGEGEFAAKGKRGSLTMTTSGAGADLEMQMVVAWPVIYIRFPAGSGAELPPGKEWVGVDMQKLGEKLGFDFNELMQANQSDPAQGLAYLREVADLETVGTEEVRGIETTHFRGVVDLRRVAEEVPEAKDSVERLIELSKVDRVPSEVWVSADGLIRRIKFSYDNMRPPGARPMDMTMQMELYDFGARVSIEEPPAAEVIPLQRLLRQENAA